MKWVLVLFDFTKLIRRRLFIFIFIPILDVFSSPLTALIVMFNVDQWTVLLPNIIEGVLCGGQICAISQICVCIVDLTKRGDETEMEKRRLLLLTLFDTVACFSLAVGKAIAGGSGSTYAFSFLLDSVMWS